MVPPALQRVGGLRPLLKRAVRKARRHRTIYQGHAADGRPSRYRDRSARLRRIDMFSQILPFLRSDRASGDSRQQRGKYTVVTCNS